MLQLYLWPFITFASVAGWHERAGASISSASGDREVISSCATLAVRSQLQPTDYAAATDPRAGALPSWGCDSTAAAGAGPQA